MKHHSLRSKAISTIHPPRLAAQHQLAADDSMYARREAIRTALVLFVIYLITWLLRAVYVGRAYDIFVDEANYLTISRSVSTTLRMATFEGPFYLHPPAFFYAEAIYLRLIQPAGNVIQQIYAGRYFNTILAAVSAVLLFLLGRRLAGWPAGIAVVCIFALEPFVIRMNSRNFIETFAVLSILAGYYSLLKGVHTQVRPNTPVSDRLRSLRRKAGLTYVDLALHTGIHARLILEIEYGLRYPMPADLHRISTILEQVCASRSRAVGAGAHAGFIPNGAQGRNPYETQPLPSITEPLDRATASATRADKLTVTWPQILGAGAAFGLALLTKETTAFLTLLPLAICFLLNWSIPRRTILVVGTVACLLYSLYPLGVAASGEWHEFAWQKSAGIRRFAGLQISTGFNHQSSGGQAPSFIRAVLSNVDQFATTYVLLCVGVVAIFILLKFGGASNRLLAVWAVSAYAQQGYSMAFGTNEEHFFYYLLVPVMLALVIAAALIVRSPRLSGQARKRLLIVTSIVSIIYIAWTSYVWMSLHFNADNGNERLFAYLQEHVPPGSCIAATTITSEWLLHDYDYRHGRWGTIDEVRSNGAEYVVVSTKLIEQGYDAATPELYQWLVQHAQPAFLFEGRTNGSLILYHLNDPAPATCGAIGMGGYYVS